MGQVTAAMVLASACMAGVALAQDDTPGQGTQPVDWVSVAIGFAAGLSLFLYGVTLLSERLREIAGDRMRRTLEASARNRVVGVATGTVATLVLDSSSVTIIVLIAIVNAGLLTFAHALPVIMGSNIGTTLSSQLFALGIDEYAPLGLLAGLLVTVLSKAERWRRAGMIVFALGLIFFGLNVIGDAVRPLEDQAALVRWMQRMETPLLGAAAGCAITVLIQSSSATMGIVIMMASQGLVSLPAGIAMMLGAEIGTCADTLVATLGRSRDAVRAGVFHLAFNVVSVALGLVFIQQLTGWAVASAGDVARQIANAHVAFNVLGTLLFLPFTATIARLLSRAIPDGRTEPMPPADAVPARQAR
ncbi:Na/Pi cotransporter family protein [Arenibaculum pallidiluteum]|uniref:Na/Pi cotransporter family protein n=1 Tax=Arenibaculum pallidiluteum TaxID=2812559 RepID=UPI001A966238|nr:Na/Pi symporter [Arenibaculum pallidiluteum]